MSDYDLEAVRQKYIGYETAVTKGRYPVEHDPIRRHCHMVEDSNPLFLDPEYAKNTRYGAVICPPSGWLAMYFASLGPWPAVFEPLLPIVPTLGKRIVNMSQGVEWLAPAKVGDHLSVRRRIADVYQKPISVDPEAVWIVSDTIITNQQGQTACVVRNTLLTHRTPEEVAAARGQEVQGADPPPPADTGEAAATRDPGQPQTPALKARRPSQPYWEEVEVGQGLPGFELKIDERRLFLQVSGSQDWYPVHFDREFARKAGHPDLFVSTGFVQAALVRVITDWMGDEGWLRKLYFEMRRQNRLGDIMACRGRVTGKHREDGQHYVECEVWAENTREGVTTPGKAWVILPSRGQSP